VYPSLYWDYENHDRQRVKEYDVLTLEVEVKAEGGPLEVVWGAHWALTLVGCDDGFGRKSGMEIRRIDY
jgi:hypothetical protein